MGFSSSVDKTGMSNLGRCLFYLSKAPDPCTQILTKTGKTTKLKC